MAKRAPHKIGKSGKRYRNTSEKVMIGCGIIIALSLVLSTFIFVGAGIAGHGG